MNRPELSERTRNAELQAKRRAGERDIVIPKVRDPDRRARCEADIYTALRTYFPHKFSGLWTDDRRAMVEAILYCAEHGGDQAIAAPRGEGKTTIAECTLVLCLLNGRLKFPLIASATGPDAKRILANIKFEFETNEQLGEDYPEVCVPIRSLEGAAQRANMQTVAGQRTHLKWADDYVILPTIDGSKASGSILAARGLDGAVRGVRYRNLRPDLVLIDDPETRESAESESQVAKREEAVEKDLAGLSGPGKRIARVMLCTIMKRECLADIYTDPHRKPSWNGKRYKLLSQKPDAADLWDEYIMLRQTGHESGDKDARQAHQFYLDRRDAMEVGGIVSNQERYIRDVLPDGTPAEVSALQHCYNIIADRGWSNFATEYQNDPPADDGPQESGITASVVRSRLNGLVKGVCRRDTVALVAAIDLGKYACHYAVTAWRGRFIGDVIDYGVQDVHNANVIGAEKALVQALHGWRDDNLSAPYKTEDGEPRKVDIVLIDAGNWDSAVYEFIGKAGLPFHAVKGVGDQPTRAAFSGRGGTDKQVGDHWYRTKQPNGLWLAHLDTDYWKQFLHERWMTEAFNMGTRRDGSVTLWGEDQKEHVGFSHHQVAEVQVEEFLKGKGLRRTWKKVSKNNHWLDAAYMCCVAGSMAGMNLERERPVVKQTPRDEEPRVNWATRYKGRWT